ncbi:hypothetical protein CIPAW_07G026900 [Carya illinoinensis]|uniref:Uncharacterized protein n=1 Tax=Carya illinoinensis TaxID=32201 RepID=A0A8T1PZ40_CARIL|nr:hypothetical protein CIPAW_07G026900 [Carya illinoinensis]
MVKNLFFIFIFCAPAASRNSRIAYHGPDSRFIFCPVFPSCLSLLSVQLTFPIRAKISLFPWQYIIIFLYFLIIIIGF